MVQDLIKWNVYEISAENSLLNGVKLRGRIRKFCLINEINILVENTEDPRGKVRFAMIQGSKVGLVQDFIKEIIPDSLIEKKLDSIANPVLSKLRVNDESRYEV